MNYIEIRDTLQSGDIVLFRGKGLISAFILWFSSVFNWFKNTRFSHIGIIIVASGRVMLLESTLNGKNGVQLNAFSEVLRTYTGGVFVRRLRCDRNERFYDVLTMTVTELLGRPFEKNLIELMGAAAEILHIFDGHKSDLTSVFCSELVTEFFRRWGFLPQSIPPNEYSPQDYDFEGRVDGELRFSGKEVCLSNVIRIK